MRNVTWICALGLGGLALAACGSSSSGTTGGSGGTSSASTTATTTATTTSGTGGTASSSTTTTTTTTTGSGGAGGSGPACGGVELTVLNYDNWCSVAVGTGTASSAGSQTVCVPDGAVTLTATALSGFQLGDWYGVTGDSGSGTPGTVSNGTSTAMVTVSGTTATCVSVCCPFTGGSGCPGSNQCP